MNIKSLLLGSAAALVAVSGARAADAIIAAEPEPVEYVRVCDAFGTGYFYIPGTETCLRIHGYLRYDVGAGELFAVTSATGDDTYFKRARFSFRTSTASETELGTLRTYTELRFQWDTNDTVTGYTNDNEFSVNFAWVQLGGLRVGKDESLFTTFTGYAGNVINDDIAGGEGPYDTNLISYTYTGGAFRAAIALEQGDDDSSVAGVRGGWGIDDYMPHVVVGLGYNAGMVDLSAVVGFDTRDDIVGATYDVGGWAAKVRADITLSEQASVWIMGMYGEASSAYATWIPYGADDSWSVMAGGSYKATDKLTFNTQVQWIEATSAAVDDRLSVVGNLNYEVVPGLVVTPEVVYYDDGTPGSDGEFGFYGRVQRSF
ncbi:porin [Hoeflea olei]|uniref:Porin n=1 Tax=Hoeflea olei TaxID=1480615 RepID=A0A1C1YW35_9HYPH|nr:porin [Hoeflea olei]OCW57692.1 hypothetical protein AWJ14_02475 [Hoeflea olei]